MIKEQHNLTDNELKKLQSVELELLCEFDRICRKYGIIYSIDGGTLLGAVRHGGFIPWDDDADVIMVRDEYEKLLEVIDIEIDNNYFYFQDINRTEGYRWGYAKLRKQNTKFVRTNQQHLKYKQGIFLDIFVCDNVPENYILRAMVNYFGYKKELYLDIEDRLFEGKKLLACKKYDEYLTFLYGDYMILPPEGKRKIHPVIEIQV